MRIRDIIAVLVFLLPGSGCESGPVATDDIEPARLRLVRLDDWYAVSSKGAPASAVMQADSQSYDLGELWGTRVLAFTLINEGDEPVRDVQLLHDGLKGRIRFEPARLDSVPSRSDQAALGPAGFPIVRLVVNHGTSQHGIEYVPIQEPGRGSVNLMVTGRRLRKVERISASVSFDARFGDLTVYDVSGVIDTRVSEEEIPLESTGINADTRTFRFERRVRLESTGNEPIDILVTGDGTTLHSLAPGTFWVVSADDFSVVIPEGRAPRDMLRLAPARDGRTYWRFSQSF